VDNRLALGGESYEVQQPTGHRGESTAGVAVTPSSMSATIDRRSALDDPPTVSRWVIARTLFSLRKSPLGGLLRSCRRASLVGDDKIPRPQEAVF
jgi:hypothetical protein